MKVELILSKTYVCMGKVYNNTDVSGKKVVYEVSTKVGRHLLAQANERNVPYFRKSAGGDQAYLAPKKSVNKGGIPVPVEDELTDPDPAEDVVVDDVTHDEDEDVASLNADGEEDDGSGDDPEEAITV